MDKHYGLTMLGATTIVLGFAVCSWAAPQAGLRQGSETNNPKFQAALLGAAKNYKHYTRQDEMARLAPALCGAVSVMSPGNKISASQDISTHGKKLYFLYLKDYPSYSNLTSPSPVSPETKASSAVVKDKTEPGQVIVKESWVPKSIPGDAPFGLGYLQPKLVPDIQGALFVMIKAAPQTPETDEGWIYGTLTPDGKTVTSAGRVQSCMSCHQAAPYGKLFGVQNSTISPQ